MNYNEPGVQHENIPAKTKVITFRYFMQLVQATTVWLVQDFQYLRCNLPWDLYTAEVESKLNKFKSICITYNNEGTLKNKFRPETKIVIYLCVSDVTLSSVWYRISATGRYK